MARRPAREALQTDSVTIPRTEYESLLACRLKLAQTLLTDGLPKRRPTSRISRDTQLEHFVDAALDMRLTHAEVRDQCLAHFGPDRSPSVSAIARHSQSRQ
jgi:hypothetical protein